MSQPLIALHNVHLALESSSGPVNILSDISIEMRSGESVALVGSSGSGKTSTMLVMAGLEQVTQGDIWVNGQNITHYNEDQLAMLRREHFGIVFQSFHLVPTMTALENVAVPLELAGHPNPMKEAAAMLDAVGLAERGHHYPAQLSGGEQQRVAIARAFAPRPGIILADEPTGNLDEENSERIINLLFALQAEYGATLLLITHDPTLAARCSRTLTMRNGQLERASHAA